MKPGKTDYVRGLEVAGIQQQLQEYDLTPTLFPELDGFRRVLEDFRDNGTSASGHVSIPRIHKKLVYVLSTRTHVESSAVLKHTEKR